MMIPGKLRELAAYARKLAERGLTSGPGGNVSLRDGDRIWVKPSGYALEELTGTEFCAVDIHSSGRVAGRFQPTSEILMHLAVYRARPDVHSIFHAHPPWTIGLISSDVEFKPLFAEVVIDLGGVGIVPYTPPSSAELADRVAAEAKNNDTILMRNHGIVCLGKTIRQAYFRCCLVEDASKAIVAARSVGTPRYLTAEEVQALLNTQGLDQRNRIIERPQS